MYQFWVASYLVVGPCAIGSLCSTPLGLPRWHGLPHCRVLDVYLVRLFVIISRQNVALSVVPTCSLRTVPFFLTLCLVGLCSLSIVRTTPCRLYFFVGRFRVSPVGRRYCVSLVVRSRRVGAFHLCLPPPPMDYFAQ